MLDGFLNLVFSRFYNFTSEPQQAIPSFEGFNEVPLVSLKEAIKPLVSIVFEIDQMVGTVERHYDGSKDNLSKDETISIMLYTLEWKPSKNSFYFILNATLRSQNRNNLTLWFPYLRLFINSVSKLPPSPHRIIYRGIQMDLSDEYPEGKEFIWWSFTSCTSSLKVLEKYIGKNGTRTIFNIVCHSGKDISQHSYFEQEQEILCFPARRFKVKSCMNTGNQLHIIQLEEIESELPFFHIPLQRRSISSSDNLGSLYDINRDCVLKQLNINDIKRSSQSYQKIQCQIINGHLDKNKNLLKIIGIQNELRLSILLNLTSKTGIASLIDYTRPINQYTRFLQYSYLDRGEQLPNEIFKTEKNLQLLVNNTDATHIITGVTLGIEFVVVLQLPSDDELVKKIDSVLDGAQDILKGTRKYSSLTTEEENILGKIVDTKIYSNMAHLMEMTSLLEICRCRNIARRRDYMLLPLMYTLQSIESLFPQSINSKIVFTLLPTKFNKKVEDHLIKLSIIIKRLKYSLDHHVTMKLLPDHLLQEVQNQWESLQNLYEKEIEYFQNLIFSIRIAQDDISEIDRTLNDSNQTDIKDRLNQLTQRVNSLEEKEHFINNLQKQNFRYYNVNESNIIRDETQESLQRKLIIDARYDRVLCSNDSLHTNNQLQFKQLRLQLIGERQNNPQLNFIYADFTYCPFKLENMMILPANILMNTDQSNRSFSITSPRVSLRSSISSDEFINILLLGETNVGKSTLINSFVNHLKFKTFHQTKSNKPTVLIPVSFSIMNKQVINLSDFDNLNNEDFNHPGQSITQHCKSYIFNFQQEDGRKLRFIDTSGFGDIRGVNQDHLNLEYILKYIHHFSYLNAVCFLFKSNTTQINGFFQKCLTQLSEYLGPAARKNFIFCFTNTRSNSSHLDNTIQLLRTALNSSKMNDISLKKENMFYFDNESFRYLVALQNGIRFNDQEKQQYETSWSTSVIESNRLIDYIRNYLIPCRLQGIHQSIKHAQFEIIPMIRPILETLRNILRNMISTRGAIQLNPQTIHRRTSMCLSCKSDIYQVGDMWIIGDNPHEMEETCSSCSCPAHQHIPMDYILKYEFSNDCLNSNQYPMQNMISKLCYISAEFAFFLMYTACSTKDDPFDLILTRMINDEQNLCLTQQSNQFNLQLINDLKKFKNDYETQRTNLKKNHQYSTVPNIYKYIHTIREDSTIREQMTAIQEGQENLMRQYDDEVPNNLINLSVVETVSF